MFYNIYIPIVTYNNVLVNTDGFATIEDNINTNEWEYMTIYYKEKFYFTCQNLGLQVIGWLWEIEII